MQLNIIDTGWFLCRKLGRNPQVVMLPNCDVVLCCMDFGLKHKLGNLLDQSYLDIVNSPNFQKIRSNRFHWDGDCLCRECDWSSIYWNSKKFAWRVLRDLALASGGLG